MCGAIAWPVLVASSSVWPSGADFAASAAANVLAAPGLFSTMKLCFIDSLNFSANMRARMSVPPPAVAPTMMRTGLLG